MTTLLLWQNCKNLILRVLIGNALFIFIYLIAYSTLAITPNKVALWNPVNLFMALSIGTFLVSYFYARYIGRKVAETAARYILDTLPTEMMWIDSQRDQGIISDSMADNDKNNIMKYSQQLSSLDSLCVVLFWSYTGVAISFLILLSFNFFYPVDFELEYFIQTEALLLGTISFWLDYSRNKILTDSNSYD